MINQFQLTYIFTYNFWSWLNFEIKLDLANKFHLSFASSTFDYDWTLKLHCFSLSPFLDFFYIIFDLEYKINCFLTLLGFKTDSNSMNKFYGSVLNLIFKRGNRNWFSKVSFYFETLIIYFLNTMLIESKLFLKTKINNERWRWRDTVHRSYIILGISKSKLKPYTTTLTQIKVCLY